MMTSPRRPKDYYTQAYTWERIPAWIRDRDGWRDQRKKCLQNHFTRVNNRKRNPTEADFRKAGYPYHDLKDASPWIELHEWCGRYIGEHRYTWFSSRFFFLTDRDRLLFLMAGWG